MGHLRSWKTTSWFIEKLRIVKKWRYKRHVISIRYSAYLVAVVWSYATNWLSKLAPDWYVYGRSRSLFHHIMRGCNYMDHVVSYEPDSCDMVIRIGWWVENLSGLVEIEILEAWPTTGGGGSLLVDRSIPFIYNHLVTRLPLKIDGDKIWWWMQWSIHSDSQPDCGSDSSL